MADQLQLRRGTTSEILLFTGAQGEVIVDTDKNTLVVEDGVTAGGFYLATEEALADGTFYYSDDIGGGSVADAYILVPKPNTNVPNAYLDGILFGFTTNNPNTGPASANFQGLGVKNIKYPGGVDPSPGDISERVDLVYDATNDWLELQRKPSEPEPELRTIGATVLSNAMTVTLQPCTIDFRSSTLSSGSVFSRTVPSAISLTIPAGATLGTQNGVANQLAIIAIDNAGTVELAVINLATATNLDESSLVSTTAISAASTSSTVFYSTSARLNVPYRVVGMVGSTQAAAGTWATPPSTIQGQGGQAIFEADIYLGLGQTWQDLTGSRALTTNYTNTTGRTICISGYVNNTTGGRIAVVVNGVITWNFQASSGIPPMPFFGIVQPGATYAVNVTTGTVGSFIWAELR